MSKHLLPFSCTLLFVSLASCSDGAQMSEQHDPATTLSRETTIPDEIGCPACRILLEPTEVIGSSADADLFSLQSEVQIDGTGNVLLTDARSYPGHLLFRAAGSSEWKILGRLGRGPGELHFPGRAWTSPEGLHVADNTTQRETVFAPDGSFINSYPLPAAPSQVVRLTTGEVVHASIVRTPGAIGYPLHVLDANREIVRSFGTDTAMLLPGARILGSRVIAPAREGGIWSARPNAYIIERWDASGAKGSTVVRDARWFQSWVTPRSHYTHENPTPRTVGLHEDDKGRLWVITYTAPPDHRPAYDQNWHGEVTEDDTRRVIDTIIEVIDPRSGQLLARERYDDVLLPQVGPMLVGRRMEAPDGSLRLEVLRMRLIP
jgi:hypothetical protein